MHLPNFSDLVIAIIEDKVKPFIGSGAIDVLKKPLKENEIRKELESALDRAEKRFLATYPDNDIKEALKQLPLANLPSLKEAVVKFYENPTSLDLEKEVRNQFSLILGQGDSQFALPASQYFIIVLEELATITETRDSLVAISTLKSQYKLESINTTLLAILETLSGEKEIFSEVENSSSQQLFINEIITWVKIAQPESKKEKKSIKSIEDIDLTAIATKSIQSRSYLKALIYWHELWIRHPENQEFFSYLYMSAVKIDRERKISDSVNALLSKAMSAIVSEDWLDAEKMLESVLLISPSNKQAADLLVLVKSKND
jgi:hypothetical protein